MIDIFDLRAKATTRAPKLSGGMRRRLLLARALMHEPELVILDEPTAGVDFELRLELWRYIRRLHAEGTTILLTTHYLEEAEELCEDIGLIRGGRVIARDTADGLRASYDADSLADVYVKAMAAHEAHDRRRRRLPRPARLRRAARPQASASRSTRSSCTTSTPGRLERMGGVLHGLAAERGAELPFRVTTDLDDAVEGADFVFCAIRVGRLEGRVVDESVPLALGVLGQETTGPGGICFALRTIPAMMRARRDDRRAGARAPG